MLAGSPGSAHNNIVSSKGTATGKTTAAMVRTSGRTHHRFTEPSGRDPGAVAPGCPRERSDYLEYFQPSISVK